MATLNVSMKFNRAISSATTVNANCFAVVTYFLSGYSISVSNSGSYDSANKVVTRFFGAGQAIPASFTVSNFRQEVSGTAGTHTYSLQTGFEIVNTQ